MFIVALIVVLDLVMIVKICLCFQHRSEVTVHGLGHRLVLGRRACHVATERDSLYIFACSIRARRVRFLGSGCRGLKLSRSRLDMPIVLQGVERVGPRAYSIVESVFTETSSTRTLRSRGTGM